MHRQPWSVSAQLKRNNNAKVVFEKAEVGNTSDNDDFVGFTYLRALNI